MPAGQGQTRDVSRRNTSVTGTVCIGGKTVVYWPVEGRCQQCDYTAIGLRGGRSVEQMYNCMPTALTHENALSGI